MLKKLSLTLALFCVAFVATSQVQYVEQPVNDRDVCFLYAEFGLPNSDNLKVVLFTSYIFRYKYDVGYSHPVLGSEDVRTRLKLAFNEKVKKITNNEYNAGAGLYNQVGLVPHIKVEWAFNSSGIARGTGPELYQSVTSPTTFNVNVRRRLLSDYQAKGYRIFQVTLDDVYNESVNVMRLEHIEKLSSLEFPVYTPGAIRNLARPYQENSATNRGSSGGLVISGPDDNKSTTTKSNSSSSRSSGSSSSGSSLSSFCASNMSYVQITAATARQPLNANNMKAWEDVVKACEYFFYYCGSDNYAVNQIYNEAKNYKSNYYQMWAEMGAQLIEDVFTPYTIYGFGYTGLDFGADTYSATEYRKVTFQLSTVKRWGHIMFEAGYAQSPNYIVTTEDRMGSGSYYWVPRRMDTLRRSGGWVGFGTGPSLRLFKNHLVLTGQVQVGALFHKKNFEDEMGMESVLNFSGGALLRLGKVGVGVDYNYGLLMEKMEKGETLQMGDLRTYTGWKKVHTPYDNWKSMGVRLLFNFKVDTRKR